MNRRIEVLKMAVNLLCGLTVAIAGNTAQAGGSCDNSPMCEELWEAVRIARSVNFSPTTNTSTTGT